MQSQKKYTLLFLNIFLPFSLPGLVACDKQAETVENKKTISISAETEHATVEPKPHNDKIIIENKSYLFDISNHSKDEFQALLTRAEEVSKTQSDDFSDLEIIMIIHGPDIEWFTQNNYNDNQQLIDLAARLDANAIIDMKVCETTMISRGVARDDLPAFIESVPYAPTEIEYRLREGYINL